jgi:hypothetical protein
MAGQSRGIEVFGRGATFVEPDEGGVRSRWLGAVALVVSLIAVGAMVAAIRALVLGSAAAGDANAFAIAALVASVLGALLGVAAVLSARGRLIGFVAVVLAAAANPWLLHRLLDWAATL